MEVLIFWYYYRMDEIVKSLGPFNCETVLWPQMKKKWADYKKQFSYIAATFNRAKKKNTKNIFLAIAGRQLQNIYEEVVLTDESVNVENEEEDTVPG